MAEIAARATEQGTILLTVTSDAGHRGQAELSADKAEDLKAQIEAACSPSACAKLRRRSRACPKQPPQRGDRWTRSRHQSGAGFLPSSGGVDWKQMALSHGHLAIEERLLNKSSLDGRFSPSA
jgi:hypothetical protein